MSIEKYEPTEIDERTKKFQQEQAERKRIIEGWKEVITELGLVEGSEIVVQTKDESGHNNKESDVCKFIELNNLYLVWECRVVLGEIKTLRTSLDRIVNIRRPSRVSAG